MADESNSKIDAVRGVWRRNKAWVLWALGSMLMIAIAIVAVRLLERAAVENSRRIYAIGCTKVKPLEYCKAVALKEYPLVPLNEYDKWVQGCTENRPLADCKADAEELFR